MGFKLITRDEVFYPADYGLKVGDELNVVMTGGGGSVMAYTDPTVSTSSNSSTMNNVLFPQFYNENNTNYHGSPDTYTDRSDIAPSSTFFGEYGEARGGKNSRDANGAINQFASGGATTASSAIGGGGGWLPGVAATGGNGGRASTVTSESGFVVVEGAPGLAGEGTTATSNALRSNSNPFGGHVSGTAPKPAVGLAHAEDVTKAFRVAYGSNSGQGSGAGAGFGAGAGAILEYRGSAAGAETKMISHRVTEKDLAEGIPVRIGRPGSFHSSRFLGELPTISHVSSKSYSMTQASVNNTLSYETSAPASTIFGAPPKRMNLRPPYANWQTRAVPLAQNGASVVYSSSTTNGYADIVYVPDITRPWEYTVGLCANLFGVVWSSSSNDDLYMHRIRYVNGYWVACVHSSLTTSANGGTGSYIEYAFTDDPAKGWTCIPGGDSSGFKDVAYFNGKYVFLKGGSTATTCVYATEDLSVYPSALTLPAFSSTNAGYYPDSYLSGLIVSGSYLYIYTFRDASNTLYIGAWCTQDLSSWTTVCSNKSLGTIYSVEGVYTHNSDLFIVGFYSSNCSSHGCQVRFENGTYRVIKSPGAMVNSYYLTQAPVLFFYEDRLYALPGRDDYNGSQCGDTVVSYLIDEEISGSWNSTSTSRKASSAFFQTTGFTPCGAITIYDGTMYFAFYSYSTGALTTNISDTDPLLGMYLDRSNGWFEVSMDDLFTMYPESFKVSGHKSAEDCYQDDWRDSFHILSGADGCCEVFW